jgi:hypothetical protein
MWNQDQTLNLTEEIKNLWLLLRFRVIAIQSSQTRTFGTTSNSLGKQFKNLHQWVKSKIYLKHNYYQIWIPLLLLLHVASSPRVFSMTLSKSYIQIH